MNSVYVFKNVGVIGLGFVGGSIYKYFINAGCDTYGYDINKHSDSLEKVLHAELIFLCLPTVFSTSTNTYDKSALIDTCDLLAEAGYNGLVVIKCTVEPRTTKSLVEQFPSLKLIHNPEFLTAATAHEDFANQSHIVLGTSESISNEEIEKLEAFYKAYFPKAEISVCTSDESEMMKIFANTFYSVKIQYFNEVWAMCQHIGANYDKVRDMIVKNGWVSKMHTCVPGTDGQLSYGGLCFPKDTNAILQELKRLNLPHSVIEATIKERNSMRSDNQNCD